MRILLVCDFFYPTIGGAERQVQLLAQELERRGHQVCVATVWQAGLTEHEVESGIAIYRLKCFATSVSWFSKDPARRFHPPFPDVGILSGLRLLIHEFQPDLIQSCGWSTYSCAAAQARRNIPLLVSVRDYGYSCARKTLIHQGRVCSGPTIIKCTRCAVAAYGLPKALVAVCGVRAGRALLTRKAHAFHSDSAYVQSIIQRDLLKDPLDGKYPGRGIPNLILPSFLGITHEELTSQADETNLSEYKLPEAPFILFVGALLPHKGVELLLAAYQMLEDRPPLVLIGTVWPESPKSFPPGITILQNVPHPVVMSAWKRCLFGVAPSTWPEPLGTVVFEAMSMGKAVIGTMPGGHTDQIEDDRSGLLIPAGDRGALIIAMKRLIENPEERERLGRAASQRVERFLAASVVPQFEATYQQLMKSRPGGFSEE